MAVLKDLIVHGSSRFLNKIYANQIQAESGFFNKLIAKDATMENATVIGLLDVKGQLHTSSWTNSNIATIDGSFYITPTIGSDEGSVIVTATTLSFSGGTYAVESLYLGDESSSSSIIWPRYSKVLVTGQILSNGEWLPLGTLIGELGANASSSSINVINIKDNKANTNNNNSNVLAAIVANGTSSTDYRNLKVSLYQRAVSSTDLRPLGIYMTAAGRNGTTFLDIYGGTKTLLSLTDTDNNVFSGFAEPVLRIGNLNGLPAVGNQVPNGWGIYTTNGYFKGTVAADNGYIGGASISNGVLTVPAANISGELTAATINGSKITANTITASQIATNAITADELAANAVTSAKIKAGEVKATNIASNAVTADKLDATTINASNKLTVGAMTTTDQNNILNSNIQIGGINLLKNTDATTIAKTITIASTSSSNYSEGWTASVDRIEGENTYTISFDAKADDDSTTVACHWYSPNTTQSSLSSDGHSGTNADGYVQVSLTTTWKRYWVTWTQSDTAATKKYLIVGRLPKPSSGTKTAYVRAIKMEIGNKATAWSPAPEDVDVHKYVTNIDSNSGITIKALNGTTDTSTTTANYIKLNASGLDIYKGGASIASYGDTARIGKTNNSRFLINASSLQAYNSSNKLYFEVSSSGIKYGTDLSSSSTTTTVATTSDVNAVSNVANAALSQSIWYATCNTAAATEEKTATITPTTTAFSLTAGVVVNVKFANTNSGAIANIKLNVNQTGAKNIKYIYNGSLSNIPSAGYLKTGQVYQFTYDGTYWVVQMMYNTNDNTVDNRIVYFTGKTGAKGIWSYSFFMEDGNGTYQNICTASNGTCTATNYTTATTKIANTNGFKVNSTIYFLANISSSVHGYAANTNISGSNVVFSSYGNVIDSRYSMNTTLTANCLTAYKPWYLVGSVNSSDGLFYLDSTWWTQTPNVTGKVYILGGGVYDSTTSNCRITLYENNQWYVYNGTSLVPYEKYASDQAAKTASSYITYVDADNGIKVHNASDTTNYLQLNSSTISMYKGGTKIFNVDNNGYVIVGKAAASKRNVYITDSAVQIRNNTSVLAEYGSSIKLYQPTTTTVAVEISSTGASFTGNITATGGSIASSVTIGTGGVSLSTIQSNANNGKEAYDLQYSSDTRNTNENPQYYITNYPRKQVNEFKSASVIGLTTGSGYCSLITIVPWGDSSGGYPKQEANFKGKRYWRQGTSATAWSAWVDASAIASNYIVADSTGLMIADMSGGTATSSNVSSQNVFIDSSSVNIRNGQDVLAKFGAMGAQIGQDGTPHININQDSISLLNEQNVSWFNIDLDAGELNSKIHLTGDLIYQRKITINNNKTDTIVSTIDISEIPENVQMQVNLFQILFTSSDYFDTSSATIDSTIDTSVYDNGNWVLNAHTNIYLNYNKGTSYPNHTFKIKNVQIKSSPVSTSSHGKLDLTIVLNYTGGNTITATMTYTITYYTDSFDFSYKSRLLEIEYYDTSLGAAFSFGERVLDSVGTTSTILGTGLQAGYNNQVVIGRYNNNQEQNAFEIGNGSKGDDLIENKNAFEITWDGDVRFENIFNNTSLNANLITAIEALEWENEVIV